MHGTPSFHPPAPTPTLAPTPIRTPTRTLPPAPLPEPGALQPSVGPGLSEAALGGDGSLSALAAGTLWQQRWRWHLPWPVARAFREQLLQARAHMHTHMPAATPGAVQQHGYPRRTHSRTVCHAVCRAHACAACPCAVAGACACAEHVRVRAICADDHRERERAREERERETMLACLR